MKKVFTLCLFAMCGLATSAQTTASASNVWARAFKKDTIFFSNDYFLVGDTCADIVRVGFFNFSTKKFTGPFKDVSLLNPGKPIAEGTYNDRGLKEGHFISYHFNGNIGAEGNFTNNMYNGRWNFYYATGKPKLSFVATANHIKILDAWNEDGKKTVDNGYGQYEAVLGLVAWSGKLVGGTPDGKWTASTLSAQRDEVLGTERFKLGQFVKGSNAIGEYTDSSRILLVSPDLLPLTKAEKMWISTTACHGSHAPITINAKPLSGTERFLNTVGERLGPVLNSLAPGPVDEPIELKGKVLKDGMFIMENTEGNGHKLASALNIALSGIENFTPARVDGRIVEQDIIITINYNSSVYSFTYRLLPVRQ